MHKRIMRLAFFRSTIFVFFYFFSAIAFAGDFDDAFNNFNAGKYDLAFPIILKEAQSGNSKAQGLLARMYGNGWGTKSNDKEAFYWATRGSKESDPASLSVLGFINLHGLAGFNKNTNTAIFYFEKAAKQNYQHAIKNLIQIYKRENNLERQIFWGEQLFSLGDAFAAAEVSIAYQKSIDIPNHLEKSFDWAMKGALAGNDYSINLVGESYRLGIRGRKKDEKEALQWFLKSASKDSNTAYYLMGLIYNDGDKTLRNEKKAIEAFENAQRLGRDEATYMLARKYLFGEKGAIKQNKPKGYELLDVLKKSNSKYLGYELESRIYSVGLDRPKNKQKAIFLALSGLSDEWDEEENWIKEQIGSWTGQAILAGNFLEEIGLPEIYDLAWYRIYKGTNSETYQEFRKKYSKDILQKSEAISFSELLKVTLDFLEARQKNIGPIEADDLINEGWYQFIGKHGKVNEPLAQLLTEEGLRLAIRTGQKNFADVAKNNLGVILISSANKNIRNARLANVHLYDGVDSRWGPDNLLWSNYEGQINLSNDEYTNLVKRYQKIYNRNHPTLDLPKMPSDIKGNSKKIIDFYISQYKMGNEELAKQIAASYEENAISIEDYKQALHWLNAGNSKDRADRIEKIIANNYEKGMPNFTGTVYQLFEVDLVEYRGGLLTSLTSAISANKNIPTFDKSKSRLNLNALIIGNASYKTKPLKNSINDAKAMSKKLKGLGFNVTEALNLDRTKFRDHLIEFSEKAKNSDVTVFYFAGHGMQLGGINYLLPIDVDFSMSETIVTYDGISLNDIRNRNLPGSTKIIFLDACRTNPFKTAITRGNPEEGLAPMNVSTGTIISFAARDGGVAYDVGTGNNSPYTQSLLKHLDDNEDIEIMLRGVRDSVVKLTNNKQEPWKYGSLSGGKLILSKLVK